jgi:hypothetical protein
MNYNNSKIYCIRSNLTDKIYIGSTTQLLSKRLYEHKNHYNSHYNGGKSLYCSSFEILKVGDYYIELLELYPCNSKEELLKREGELIRENIKNTVNKIISGRKMKEWREDNKEYRKEYAKEYRGKHKEEINKNIKEYYNTNKEILKEKRKEKNRIIKEKKKKELEEFKLTDEYNEILRQRRIRKTYRDKLSRIEREKKKKELY